MKSSLGRRWRQLVTAVALGTALAACANPQPPVSPAAKAPTVSSVTLDTPRCATTVSLMQQYNEANKLPAQRPTACFAPLQPSTDGLKTEKMCHPNSIGNFCCMWPEESCKQCSSSPNTPC
jgi:hypothetical protein